MLGTHLRGKPITMIANRPHQWKSAHTALAVKACLLGCNSATLNAQVTFVFLAVAISALAGGGALKIFAPKPNLCWCFRNCSDDFLALDLKRVLRWNFGSFWGGSGNRKTDVGGFRQRKNGQQWKKTANTDVFKGFGMLEYWTHCKNQCFGPTLYWRTRKLCCFWRKDWNNTVRTCVLDRLYAQKWSKMYKLRGCWRKTIKTHCRKKLKHVQYLYKDRTKKLAVWAAPHAKRGEYS